MECFPWLARAPQMEADERSTICTASLLPFHRRMVQELTDADGVCVMAAGQLQLLAQQAAYGQSLLSSLPLMLFLCP